MSYFDTRHHGREGKYSPPDSILEDRTTVNHNIAAMTAIIGNLTLSASWQSSFL